MDRIEKDDQVEGRRGEKKRGDGGEKRQEKENSKGRRIEDRSWAWFNNY